MLVIAANQNNNERIGWLAGFIFVLIQDFMLNPFVIVAIDLVYRKIVGEKPKKKLATKILSTVLMVKDLDEVHVIYHSNLTNIPRPTPHFSKN